MTANTKKTVSAHVKNDESYNLSHPEKVLYPETGITKLDLATYYHEVHEWMLPHVAKRPLTIVRCPQGIGQKCFFQKHPNETHNKVLPSIMIQEKNAKTPYSYLTKEESLIALVQANVLEIHLWACHINAIEKPDFLTFDLDPNEEVEWKTIIETAHFMRDKLAKLSLQSFVKTTGGKGLHVVVPIQPQYDWKEIEIFAKTFVDYLVSLKPDLYLSNMSKAKRVNKIFLDYLRNQRGATAIAPYSTRARVSAPVATPLSWDELTVKIKSDSFNIHNVPQRLKKIKEDPWEEFFLVKQKLRLPK